MAVTGRLNASATARSGQGDGGGAGSSGKWGHHTSTSRFPLLNLSLWQTSKPAIAANARGGAMLEKR